MSTKVTTWRYSRSGPSSTRRRENWVQGGGPTLKWEIGLFLLEHGPHHREIDRSLVKVWLHSSIKYLQWLFALVGSSSRKLLVKAVKDCWIVFKRSAFMHISIIACEPIGDDEIIVARNREIRETKTAQNGQMAINLKAGKCVNYPDIHRFSQVISSVQMSPGFLVIWTGLDLFFGGFVLLLRLLRLLSASTR